MTEKKKSWFARHKILTVILAFIVIGVIASAAGGGSKSTNSTSGSGKSNSGEKTYRFNDRADKQSKDVEVLPGETATVGDVKMMLTNVEYKTSVSDYEKAEDGKTYVVADVTLENNSNKTQPYNT
jgi:septal ring-binding cell division protein DamX